MDSISTRPIAEYDIEMLRVWKNVNKGSFFLKEDITEQQQIEWYKGFCQRNRNLIDFMFIIEYDKQAVGCIGYRIIDNVIDIYNLMLGDKEYQGKGIVSTASKDLWLYLGNYYELDITAKVLNTNAKTIEWYLKNNWIIQDIFDDYTLLRLQSD